MSDEKTTTGEREAIAKKAATAAVDELLSRDRTPPLGQSPRTGDSSEHIRQIARDEAERTCEAMIGKYRQQCVDEGPICGVWEEIGNMRDAIAEVKEDQAQQRGEASGIMKAQARQTTIIVAAITGVGVVAQVIASLLRMRHGG